MDEHRDEFPRPSDFPRLADVYGGDGFPVHGPWTPLSDAVIDDALEALKESREQPESCIRCGQGTFMRGLHLTTGTAACPDEREQVKAQIAGREGDRGGVA